MQVVKIDARHIHDWNSFHDAVAKSFGFPASYGRNVDALIDCLTDLDAPGSAMSAIHVPQGQVVTIVLEHVAAMQKACPVVWHTFQGACAFVNWRRLEKGQPPVVALAWMTDE